MTLKASHGQPLYQIGLYEKYLVTGDWSQSNA